MVMSMKISHSQIHCTFIQIHTGYVFPLFHVHLEIIPFRIAAIIGERKNMLNQYNFNCNVAAPEFSLIEVISSVKCG